MSKLNGKDQNRTLHIHQVDGDEFILSEKCRIKNRYMSRAKWDEERIVLNRDELKRLMAFAQKVLEGALAEAAISKAERGQ